VKFECILPRGSLKKERTDPFLHSHEEREQLPPAKAEIAPKTVWRVSQNF